MDPTPQVLLFAARLGWRDVRRHDITPPPEFRGSPPAATIITCWSSNDVKFFIQINQAVVGQFGQYRVSVVAERYGLRPLDFAPCAFATDDEAIREAERLAPLFSRSNFREQKWRRRYLESHPEKLFDWRKKWRGWKSRLRHGFRTEGAGPRKAATFSLPHAQTAPLVERVE